MKKYIIFLFIITFNCVFAQKYTPTYIQKKELQKDLIFLKEKVTKIHPKFLDKDFHSQWNKQYNKIFFNIPDSITFNESYVMISPLMSVLKDGHSNFSFPYSERIKYMKNNGVTMPLNIKIKDNRIYIEKYFGEKHKTDIIGSEILSINKIPVEKILKDLQFFYGAKNISIINNNIEKYFGAYFWTVYGKFSQYNIEILNGKKHSLLSLQRVTNNEYFTLKKKFYPKQPEMKYEVLFFDNHNFAYLKIKSFANKITLSEFLINAFDTIKINNSENLIIDLRDNFGGTSDCVDTLLSYLTNKEYKQYKSIGLRVSDTIKNKYKSKNFDLYEKIKSTMSNQLFYYNDSMLSNRKLNRENHFNGNVFVLINNKTYSAASTFAGVIKEYDLGEIVGQTETGGTIEYYGDFLFFKLPNTKMDFFISPKIFIQYGGNDMDKGVFPDIKIYNDDIENSMIVKRLTNTNNVYKKLPK